MRYFLTFLSISIFFNQNLFAQNETKNYTEAFKLIEVWLDAQKDFENLPGISAAVIEDQEILWQGSAGLSNIEGNVKTQPSTICSICSISKLFTSVAIMKLYDEGKLRLDDRISDLLPAYKIKQQYPESGPITIRSILTHSSGLPREAAYPYWTKPDFEFPTKTQIDSKLNEQETLYPASTYFQYSNLGITLLGEIVEEISGVSYENYVQENIIKPLKLTNTKTELPEALYGKDLAIGYGALSRSGKRDKLKLFQANGITPAAGLSSNVIDLGKFASWQLRLRDSTVTEILKPSTLKYMHNVHWIDPDWNTTWGLGFRVFKGYNGNKWVSHSGSCPGYRTTLQIDVNRKRAFSVMINASNTSPEKYIRGIDGILNRVETINDNTNTEFLKEFAGYYNPMPWSSETYISTWNDKLAIIYLPTQNLNNSISFFKHIKDDTFRRIRDNGELGETLTFERDKKGNVYRYIQHGNYSIKKDNPS